MWASRAVYVPTSDITLLHYISGTSEFHIRYNPTIGLYLYTSLVSVKPTTPILLTPDIWTHIAISYDRTTAKFYINGALVATVTASSPVITSPGVISIGKKVVDFTKDLTLPAFGVDELRVWSTVLTQATIQSLMGATLTTSQPNLLRTKFFSFSLSS